MVTKKSSSKPRMRTYKDSEGNYLTIETAYSNAVRISWFIAEFNDFGSHLGEPLPTVSEEASADEDRARKEWEIATNAVAPFAEGQDSSGFYFETEKRAREALRAANEALFAGEIWPEWAIKAKAAGWTPPEGWKP